MAQTDPQTLIENGITALKAGDHAQARQQLAAAIEQDPRNERAWLYLSAVLPPQQARTALERVLTINPRNERARRGLETLQSQPSNLSPTQSARKVKSIKPALIEELPGTTNQPTSRFVPELTLVETLQPRSEPVFFDRGYRPIELDRDGNDLAQVAPATDEAEAPALNAPDEEAEAVLTGDPALRHLLTEPYLRPRKRHWGWWLMGLLLLASIVGGGVYYWLNYTNQNGPVDTAQATVEPTQLVEASPTEVSQSNLNNPPTPANPPTPVPPTTVPPSPTPTTLKLSLAQNERAILRGYIVTFSGYENRSNNFSFNGAGTPKSGFHFEGLIVGLENTGPQAVPVQLDTFQAVDGRSNFLKPSPNGRVPALDATRLQPGEQQIGWLTFEVEDGTTLRRVTFNPTTALDRNNQADVNLTLPSVTPAATPRPTFKPTATPLPTATALPTVTPAPTATPAPTVTPAPPPTVIVADASPNAYVPTVDIPTAASPAPPVPSTSVAATATDTPEATAPPTQEATPTLAVTPTPAQPTPAPGIPGELNKKVIVGSFAITATTYVVSPTIKPPPLVLPVGYHYETVKLTVENTGGGEVADYLATMPFYLRDADNRLYSVGPQTFEASDKFNPKVFAPTNSAPGKTKVTGVLYFLVRDSLKNPARSLIFYATPELDSPRLQLNLSAKQT